MDEAGAGSFIGFTKDEEGEELICVISDKINEGASMDFTGAVLHTLRDLESS